MDVEAQGTLNGATVDGRYVLLRVLGQGAEGTVYEAAHRFTGKRHAVKIASVRIAQGTDLARVRLLREARALGQIRHPNIVAINDAGVADGFPFVAMELLEGRSLDSLLVTRRRFAVADAVAAALQVCAALAAAHAVKVLHRDVKPANIIVVREGAVERVKLIDFGTAKPTDSTEARVTAVGALVGTPAYMAPEQLLARDVDERTDVYGVGAMLFECLTSAVPYEGDYPNVMMAACGDAPPPSVRLVRPELDASLEGVVLKALAKKPADRYATIAQLVDALRRACPQVDGLTRLLDVAPTAAQPRRKFDRAAYRTPVRVTSQSWGHVDGRSEDVSEGGMLLMSQHACKTGDEVSVRFALPIEGRIATIRARVQWVTARPNRPEAQAIGLEFVDVTTDIRASIARYVALMTGKETPDSRTKSGEIPIAHTTMPGTPAALARAAQR